MPRLDDVIEEMRKATEANNAKFATPQEPDTIYEACKELCFTLCSALESPAVSVVNGLTRLIRRFTE